MTLTSRGITHEDNTIQQEPKVRINGLAEVLDPWILAARERIFSLAAGNRVGKIAPRIMEIGMAKVLYSANELGSDIEKSNPFAFFAPDGTITYNIERIKRGFTYGVMLNLDFDGMIATNNSMPNGCGFSMYEIEDPLPDHELKEYLTKSQHRLGEDQLSQLGKGNHFAGVYTPLDPVTGEDSLRRFVVIHCSGHVGGEKLYFPEIWLKDEEGYHEVTTPHGNITFLEGEAKKRFVNQCEETENANATNRDITMAEIFEEHPWTKLEEITHQGFLDNGSNHIIGTQRHKGMMPIAFNPDEGLIAIKAKPNLSKEFLDYWDQGSKIKELGLEKKFTSLDLTPHGGGYEFKHPVDRLNVNLDKNGVQSFNIKFTNIEEPIDFEHFRNIRDFMTYRRRAPVMKQLYIADLAEILFELPGLMQIYPNKSIPGGSH